MDLRILALSDWPVCLPAGEDVSSCSYNDVMTKAQAAGRPLTMQFVKAAAWVTPQMMFNPTLQPPIGSTQQQIIEAVLRNQEKLKEILPSETADTLEMINSMYAAEYIGATGCSESDAGALPPCLVSCSCHIAISCSAVSHIGVLQSA